MKDRTEKLSNWKIPTQPYVVVCGPSVDNVDATYVVVDKVMYLMSSPLRALDVCFKIIHALHARYSPECHRLWMLIQKKLYELDTKFDSYKNDSQLPLLLRKFN